MKLPVPMIVRSVLPRCFCCWSVILAFVIAGCDRGLDKTLSNDDERSEASTFVQATDETFAQEVLKHPNPVVVIMSTRWCPECQKAKPHLQEIANQLEGKVRFREVDVERNTFLAEKYEITQYPSVLILIDGQVQERLVGTAQLKGLKLRLDAASMLSASTRENAAP
ncbi:thioredoxin family protein [Bremerella sp.]|uniref:thioredoxin family protein n=1 Tax=Bremerella sp. TaxID=2795602 RepID=UPI00391DFEAD